MRNLFPSAGYEIWLGLPTGEKLTLLDGFNSITFAKAFNSVGRFEISLPTDLVNNKFLKEDYTIQIWRTPYEKLSKLVFAGFINKIVYFERGKLDIVSLSGKDGNSLLKSRIIAYASGSTESEKSTYLDDAMKAIVDENLGASATDPKRDLSNWISIDPNYSLAPNKAIARAWQQVIDACKDISSLSFAYGTPLFFEMEPIIKPNSISWNFKTEINQLGSDRTFYSGIPTVFSKEAGNLEDPRLEYDFEDSFNYVYVGGEGEAEYRTIEEAEDTNRIRKSVFGRKEKFFDYRHMQSSDDLTTKAVEVLQSGEFITRFTGRLKDTPQTRYGVDWEYGDKVSIEYRDEIFDAWIDGISLRLDEAKNETIDVRIEVVK